MNVIVNSTNVVMDIIDEHLQEVNHDQKERLERITILLDFLNFNRRLTELSDEERLDFFQCENCFPLTDKQREILDKKPKERDYYFEMWARSTYFRLCAWRCYLFGEDPNKPRIRAS